MSRYLALVPAAGSGSRFGGPSPKQYLQLNNRPLMWHTLQVLSQVEAISEVAVVISPMNGLMISTGIYPS
jgi:2-C-methyl-D-erythritol 4-phosphate cytidylyltransferase